MVTQTRFPTLLAFDTTQRRPGCVLIQGAMGGDPQAAQNFPSETWLLAPTDDMKVYRVENESQLDALIAMATKAVR